MDKANALGDYLQARRDLARPRSRRRSRPRAERVPAEMVIYHAEPGTESGQALALLGSIAATAERDAAERDTATRAVAEQAAPPAGTYNPEKESS